MAIFSRRRRMPWHQIRWFSLVGRWFSLVGCGSGRFIWWICLCGYGSTRTLFAVVHDSGFVFLIVELRGPLVQSVR
jgi:hypothetical protein